MENSSNPSSPSSKTGISYNAHDSAITIENPSTDESLKSSNTNLQSIFSSPLTSLRSLTRRSTSKELSRSISESTSDEGTEETARKVFDCQESDLERRNLLNMIKMSVKNLIESSLAAGHTLDNDNQALQQFFIIFENVLRHRLKGSKRFFLQNRYFWPVLESVEKFHSAAGPITVSVKSLPGVKTFLGKARAWIRLALMQKKLSEYFQVFVEHKDFFREWYEDDAVILNEEAAVMLGHLVGINCIDANLCIREMDLDNQTTMIDFGLYVKDTEHYANQNEEVNNESVTQNLLNQKNYLEERNRHLETNLKEALKKLEVQNKTMDSLRTELEASKIQLNSVNSNNEKLQAQLRETLHAHQETLKEQEKNMNSERDAWIQSKTELDRIVSEMKAQLKQETAMRLDVEKELQQEMALKQELEMVVKFNESDLSHKQQGLVALRQQLDNVKMANADLYLKLQAKTNGEENDSNSLEDVENQTNATSSEIVKLHEELEEVKRQEEVAREQAGRYSNLLDDSEKSRNVLTTNLQIERDWRENLQTEEEKHKQEVILLQEKIEMMMTMKEEMENVIKDRDRLQKLCFDHQILPSEKSNQSVDTALKIDHLSSGEG